MIVVVRGGRVEVASQTVGAASHFQGVANAIPVGVGQTRPAAVVMWLCEVAPAGDGRRGVVVASVGVRASGARGVLARTVVVARAFNVVARRSLCIRRSNSSHAVAVRIVGAGAITVVMRFCEGAGSSS